MAEKENRSDEQFSYEIEFNIYECFHKKYTLAETDEEETEEEEEIPEYEYTKYTDDSGSIVYVEFENGTFFLLNYNDYAVTVEFNGATYTLETYGGIKVVSGQEPESFSFAKIN